MSLGSLCQLRASTQSSRSRLTTVIWVSWLAQVGPSWNPVKSAGGQPPMTRAAVKHPPGYAVIPNRPDTTLNVSADPHRTVTSLPRRHERASPSPRRRRSSSATADARHLACSPEHRLPQRQHGGKGSNCKSLNVAHKDRCIVCKKPGDNYVRRRYARRCLTAMSLAEQPSASDALSCTPCEEPGALSCSSCEEPTAPSCSCCSSTFFAGTSAGA